jgi:hypothetical protein
MGGTLEFMHYDTRVLSVNFDSSRITDYGFDGYSTTTDRNIREWVSAMRQLGYIPKYTLPYNWAAWTANGRARRPRRRQGKSLNNVQKADELFDEFRRLAPWCGFTQFSTDGPMTRWFDWDKYDDKFAQRYWDSKRFLATDQNYRYFTYVWDMSWMRACLPWPLPHHWIRRFISGDAERRWKKRERKHGRPCQPIC